MKHSILGTVLLTLAVASGAACSSEGSQLTPAYVEPFVVEALERDSVVEALVFLRPPDLPPDQQTIDLRRQNYEERLGRVLEALGQGDFQVEIESEQAGALTGMLTKDGLAVLREHQDVRAVALARSRDVELEGSPAVTTLTGEISRLVEYVFDDGVVVEEILEPVTNGVVAIPELGVEQPLGPDGSFSFTYLELPEYPMLGSIEVQAEGFRPTTWANYLVLYRGLGPNFTPRLELGDEPKVIDQCSFLSTIEEQDLSAAQHQHWRLCPKS